MAEWIKCQYFPQIYDISSSFSLKWRSNILINLTKCLFLFQPNVLWALIRLGASEQPTKVTSKSRNPAASRRAGPGSSSSSATSNFSFTSFRRLHQVSCCYWCCWSLFCCCCCCCWCWFVLDAVVLVLTTTVSNQLTLKFNLRSFWWKIEVSLLL